MARPSLSIEAAQGPVFESFFQYLDDHLRDNGQDGRYFQPLSSAEPGVTPEQQTSFRTGQVRPIGAQGWRRTWVARGPDYQIVGHIDLRGRLAPHLPQAAN